MIAKIDAMRAEQRDIKEKCERWTMPRGKLFNADREIAVLHTWFEARGKAGLSRAELEADRVQVKARMDQIRKYEREIEACDERDRALDAQVTVLADRIAIKSGEVDRMMSEYHTTVAQFTRLW